LLVLHVAYLLCICLYLANKVLLLLLLLLLLLSSTVFSYILLRPPAMVHLCHIV